jgi:hypothetical protein
MQTMNYEQRNRLEKKAVEIAERLGRKAGEEVVAEDGCNRVGLMGRYERSHFGIADFEDEFVARLAVSFDRVGADQRTRDEIERSCWSAWVLARNARVQELCPRAREYGSD